MKKKLLAFLLCAAMLATTLALPVSALAEGTHFLLTLVGETALRDGTWESEPVVAEFRAVQHDETVGILKADGETRLACEGGTLILYPVAETLPEGWHFEAGYAVNLTDNALNRATIRLQAEAGFFKAAAEPGAVILRGGAPHVLSLSLPGCRSEVLLNYLDARGIRVSKSSACKRGKRSHVLEAMGLPDRVIDGAIRVSFSRYNTMDECRLFCEELLRGKAELFGSL